MFSVVLERPIRVYVGMDPTLTSSVDHLTAGDVDIEPEEYPLPVAPPLEAVDVEAAAAAAANEAAHHEYAEALSLSSQRNHRHWRKQKHTIRNFLSLGAILLALMLIVGAIYLHLRQKHHLGRLSHNYFKEQEVQHLDYLDASSTPTPTPEASANSFPLRTAPSVVAQITTTTDKSQTQQLDDECLACIAFVTTGSKPAKCSGELNCGIYRISHRYWLDAIQQTMAEPYSMDYEHCVVDDKCAERIVRGYVERYARDCNQDGLIECRDHVLLHLLGPTGCLSPNRIWPIYRESAYNKCVFSLAYRL